MYKTTRELRSSKLELTTQEKINRRNEEGRILDLENQYILDTEDMYEDTEKGRQKLFEIVNKTIK